MTYNKADDDWTWTFYDRATLGNFLGLTGPYDTADINNKIDEYSDLSYEQYQFVVGGTYQFTEALYTTASFTYDIFNSDEEYVYGDEDGKAYSGYWGVGYRF